jgi:hypothetical protein
LLVVVCDDSTASSAYRQCKVISEQYPIDFWKFYAYRTFFWNGNPSVRDNRNENWICDTGMKGSMCTEFSHHEQPFRHVYAVDIHVRFSWKVVTCSLSVSGQLHFLCNKSGLSPGFSDEISGSALPWRIEDLLRRCHSRYFIVISISFWWSWRPRTSATSHFSHSFLESDANRLSVAFHFPIAIPNESEIVFGPVYRTDHFVNFW